MRVNKNIPNIISVFRIILTVVFVIVFFSDSEYNTEIAALIFLIAGLSDMLDGYLARKYNLITPVGKILDPIADKLMQFTVSICVSFIEPMLIWVPVFLFLKEITMLIGAVFMLKKKKEVSANLAGKLSSVTYFIVFLSIMLFNDMSLVLRQALCIVFALTSVSAFIVYMLSYLSGRKSQKI